MAIVGFWSTMHGVGTTMNLLSTAICLAEKHDKKVLVMQTNFSMNNLEMPLVGKIDKETSDLFFEDIGLDMIMRLYKSGNLNAQTAKNATVNFSENFSLLAGTKEQTSEIFEDENECKVVKKVIKILSDFYDVVLIDTNSGFPPQTKAVLEIADKIVVNVRQNRRMIEEIKSSSALTDLSKDKEIIYMIGSHIEESKNSFRGLTHGFNAILKPASTVCIPLNVGYMDAISDCNAYKYLLNEFATYNADIDTTSWLHDVDKAALKLI